MAAARPVAGCEAIIRTVLDLQAGRVVIPKLVPLAGRGVVEVDVVRAFGGCRTGTSLL